MDPGLDKLPLDILNCLTNFLDEKSITLLSGCNTFLRQILPRFSIKKHGTPAGFSFSGLYHDPPAIVITLEKSLFAPIYSFTIRGRWKDQGWGNRKGTLMLKVLYNGTNQNCDFGLKSPAPHNWEDFEITIGPRSHLVEACEPGDTLELWRIVGGGGGHHLYIQNLETFIRYESYNQANKIKEKKEKIRAQLKDYAVFMKKLKDQQFTASSEWDFQNRTHASYNCRISDSIRNSPPIPWCSGINNSKQWLQIDFKKVHKIKSMVLVGREQHNQYVTTFKVGVSFDGSRWCLLNKGEIFFGPNNCYTPVFISFKNAIGRYIRIYPLGYCNHISIRCGFLGSPLKKIPTKTMELFDKRMLIQEKIEKEFNEKKAAYISSFGEFQISASSFWNDNLSPISSLLDSEKSAWCAKTNQIGEWIQFDFLKKVEIYEIATQGRDQHYQFVTKFQISVSDDGSSFTLVNNGQIFIGNFDNCSIVFHSLCTVGRYLRLLPMEWNNHISLRWGALVRT